jgi:hypothetical protein
MRNFIPSIVLAAGLCPMALLHAEDGLFSEVAMESVFEKNASITTTSVASLSDGEKLERITGTSSLMLALKFVGFTPKEVGDRVTFHVDHASWKLPVSMAVELEQDQIVCDMSLIEIAEAGTVDSDGLLKLLEKNDVVGGYFFAYDTKTKLLQLRSSFSNRGLSAKQLKANILRIATFADKHSELWSNLKSKPTAKAVDPKTPAKPTTTLTKPSATTPGSTVQLSSLVGLWGATIKSGETIAIQMSADGAFKLATVKSGKSSLSKGKATLAGNKLTLVGDDKVTLNCSVSQVTATQFQLAINDDKGTTKLTVQFQKSK